jgi:hypothetical protein
MASDTYEWQEVSRLYLSQFNQQRFGDLPGIFESLKKTHGADARIEIASIAGGNTTVSADGQITPVTNTYFKVIKYLPVTLVQAQIDQYEERFTKKVKAPKSKKAKNKK